MDVIGILDSASPESRGAELRAFFDGLASAGVTGQDAMVLYAWANNNYSQLSGLAQQLIDNADVRVIVAAGGPVSALAVRSLTTTKPIVFTTITNPVTSQLVLDLNAPGGNATGTWGHTTELDPVRLKALCDLTPGGGPIGILTNPNRPQPITANAPVQKGGLESKASDFGRSAIVVDAENDSQIDGAFATFNGAIAGLLVTADPFFNNRRERVIELAANLNVPAIYQWSGFVEDGGLMSYGPSKEEGYFNAGEMAGDILKNGTQPATLPVRQTNAFALVINDDTAASIGLNMSGPAFTQMVANLGVADIRHI